jgi:hypothetical protein
LQGMDADRAVEVGGGEQVWIARAPLDLECPIVGGWKLRKIG